MTRSNKPSSTKKYNKQKQKAKLIGKMTENILRKRR